MIFWIVKIIIYIPYRILYPTRFVNKKKLREHRRKGVVFVCNHKSYGDPPLLCVMFTRRLEFLVKPGLMKKKFWAWLLGKHFGCFPVKKGNDLALVRHSMAVLKRNRAMMIFPEGMRVFNAEDALALRQGAAMIAIKAGVPIVPMVLRRAPRLFVPNAIKVGDAISTEQYQGRRLEKTDLAELSGKVQGAMAGLLEGFEHKAKVAEWEQVPSVISRGVVIIDDERLLVVKREKGGQQYYVFPGGHIDEGESAREAAVREIREETNIESLAVRLLYKYENGSDPSGYSNGMQSFYLCTYKSGVVSVTDAEEYTGTNDGRGTYEPMEVDISQLGEIDLRPNCVRDRLVKDIAKYGTKLTRSTIYVK